MRFLLIGIGLLGMLWSWSANAQDKPEGSWWDTPDVRRCCSIGDSVWAEEWRFNPDGSVTARVTGGGPRNHSWAPIGREYTVSPDRLITTPGNPTGRAMLFLHPVTHSLYCFAAGPLI